MASSSSAPKQMYDVFISFRGKDTRHNFTGHFYAALRRKKVRAYIDEDGLEKGDEISSSLSKAIEESKISVVIFSENYASSSWCLTELAHILRCKVVNKQLVVPIFYHVDPSDIRQQRNSYAAAFAKHETRFEDAKVQMWRNALKEAGNMCGWNIDFNRSESEVIEEIVKDILNRLDKQDEFKDLVGIDIQVQNIELLLHFSLLDVRIVGLFSELLKEKIVNVDQFVRDRLQRTKVLVVLDDVDEFEQLVYLVRDRDWFGQGSRIIITTRDKQVLTNIEADGIYELSVHDLVQDMGKEIVRQESPNEPGGRSRLWLAEDVCSVLKNNTATPEIQGIVHIHCLCSDQENLRILMM